MADEDRNVYRYTVKQKGKIIFRGWTYDLKRRASEHKARYPDCIVKQVGKKVTLQEAEQWDASYKYHNSA